MTQSHDGFLVKQHRPSDKWFVVAVVLLLLAMAFFAGRWDENRELEQSYELMHELNLTIEQLTRRNEELVLKNARLLGDSKVERDAYNSANDSLVALQREILLQKEELVFYRGIVSPGSSEYGVNLQEFSVLKAAKENQYQFKLVLTKSGKSNYSIRGNVFITVQGLMGGEDKSFKLSELIKEGKSELKYSFRYFQIFEGEIHIPDNFFPEVIKVNVKSKTKKVKSVNDTFNWSELTSGEE